LDAAILGMDFDFVVVSELEEKSDSGINSINIVGFFIELSRYSIVSYVSDIIITRFLKVIQFIPLNLLFSRKIGILQLKTYKVKLKKNFVLGLIQENLMELLSTIYLTYIYYAISLCYTKHSLF